MAKMVGLIALVILLPVCVSAQPQGLQDPLLDHLIGKWVLRGTIAGKRRRTTSFEWVLGHQYVRLHEVSREKNAKGQAAYEAIVFIGWDQPSGRTRACGSTQPAAAASQPRPSAMRSAAAMKSRSCSRAKTAASSTRHSRIARAPIPGSGSWTAKRREAAALPGGARRRQGEEEEAPGGRCGEGPAPAARRLPANCQAQRKRVGQFLMNLAFGVVLAALFSTLRTSLPAAPGSRRLCPSA